MKPLLMELFWHPSGLPRGQRNSPEVWEQFRDVADYPTYPCTFFYTGSASPLPLRYDE
ncbi:hypothetical protein [Porticoccus sp.]